MFTKPVRTMLLVTAILVALAFWKVDDRPGDQVEVPDLGAISKSLGGQ
jgi:hypothetical protein